MISPGPQKQKPLDQISVVATDFSTILESAEVPFRVRMGVRYRFTRGFVPDFPIILRQCAHLF